MDATDCYGGVEPRRAAVTLDGTRISYLEWGAAGAPALLLHGITSSARAWWRVAPALVAAGCHVYAIDMPGHGESDEMDNPAIEHLADLLVQLMRRLALERPLLMGHSWGGATALTLASRADAPALGRVALIDPVLDLTPDDGEEALAGFVQHAGKPRAETLPLLPDLYPGWQPCDRFWKAEALEQCRAAAVRAFCLPEAAWDITPRLADVAAPLLLMTAGPQASTVSPERLAEAERLLRPGLGHAVAITEASHNIFRDHFEEFMDALMGWMQRPA